MDNNILQSGWRFDLRLTQVRLYDMNIYDRATSLACCCDRHIRARHVFKASRLPALFSIWTCSSPLARLYPSAEGDADDCLLSSDSLAASLAVVVLLIGVACRSKYVTSFRGFSSKIPTRCRRTLISTSRSFNRRSRFSGLCSVSRMFQSKAAQQCSSVTSTGVGQWQAGSGCGCWLAALVGGAVRTGANFKFFAKFLEIRSRICNAPTEKWNSSTWLVFDFS